jgi:hypothetical protein
MSERCGIGFAAPSILNLSFVRRAIMAKPNKNKPNHSKPYNQKVAAHVVAKRATQASGSASKGDSGPDESELHNKMRPDQPKGIPNPKGESRLVGGPDAERNPLVDKKGSRPPEAVLDKAKERYQNGPPPDEI